MKRDSYSYGSTPDNAGGYYYGDPYGYGSGGYGGGIQAPSRTFRDYLVILRERFWWLVLSVSVIFLGSVLYTINAPELYRANASVQILRKTEVASMPTNDNNLIRTTEDFNTQVKILESAQMVQRVAARLNAEETARFFAPYENTLSILGAKTPEEVLMRNRRIIPKRLSLIVDIQYIHPDREMARKISNLFADEYMTYGQALGIEGAMKSVEDLKVKVAQQGKKVEDIELQMANFKEQHDTMVFDPTTPLEEDQLRILNQSVSADKRIVDELATMKKMLETYKTEGRSLLDLHFIASGERVSELRARLSNYEIEIAQLSKRYKEKHPVMITARKAQEQAAEELEKAVQSSVEKLLTNYRTAEENYEKAKERLKEKQQEIAGQEKIYVTYSSLKRDVEVSRSLYQMLYGSLQTSIVDANQPRTTARMIDQAFAESRPFKPNHLLNLAFGLCGGVAFGVGLVFFLAFVDDKVKSAYDIETAIGLPLLGLIPKIKTLDASEKAQVVANNQDKHVIEAFRSIHSTLKLNEESKKAKVILLTSTIPGEGKSFVSSNLAITLAGHGDRTILIDCDLRMPNVAKSLQVENEVGVIDHFDTNTPLEDLIQKDIFPNLDVLPTGGKARNPTQILSSEQFENMIHELRMRYDKVVIDSPPLAPVSDALSILPLADGVIFVIRFNTVKRKTAKLNVRRLFESNVPVLGAVLNNISSTVAGYYYSHYYDKSYRDYYIDTDDEEELDVDTTPASSKRASVTAETEDVKS